MLQVFPDRRLQGRPAPDALLGDLGEVPLDSVQPRAARRREVSMILRMSPEPPPHRGRLVRRVVVQHPVDLDAGPFGTLASISSRNLRNSWCRWRRWHLPITSPVA